MPIMAVVNQKGGTGKTTVATNLAALFASQGREGIVNLLRLIPSSGPS
jgi:cellulose biosynthesis protein BcsQ